MPINLVEDTEQLGVDLADIRDAIAYMNQDIPRGTPLAEWPERIKAIASRIVEEVFLSSVVATAPPGTFKADFAIVGAGGNPVSTNSNIGSGGSRVLFKDVPVNPGDTFVVTVGQAGGVNTQGGSSSVDDMIAPGGVPSHTASLNTAVRLWGDDEPSSLLVCGRGVLQSLAAATILTEEVTREIMAGGGFVVYYSTTASARPTPPAGLGGGGAYYTNRANASSGRVHIRWHIRD